MSLQSILIHHKTHTVLIYKNTHYYQYLWHRSQLLFKLIATRNQGITLVPFEVVNSLCASQATPKTTIPTMPETNHLSCSLAQLLRPLFLCDFFWRLSDSGCLRHVRRRGLRPPARQQLRRDRGSGAGSSRGPRARQSDTWGEWKETEKGREKKGRATTWKMFQRCKKEI